MRWPEQKKKFVFQAWVNNQDFMGIGKFEVDVYYNDIKHRMQTIRSKLEKSRKTKRATQTRKEKDGF